MRPDTPQSYRQVLVEDIKGLCAQRYREVSAWTQFYNKLDRDDMPISRVDNVTVRNVDVTTTKGFYKNAESADYITSGFDFSNITADGKALNSNFKNKRALSVCNEKNYINILSQHSSHSPQQHSNGLKSPKCARHTVVVAPGRLLIH